MLTTLTGIHLELAVQMSAAITAYSYVEVHFQRKLLLNTITILIQLFQ